MTGDLVGWDYDDLFDAAERIASYWADRSDRWLRDEYASVCYAAAGEAVVRHDPDRIPLRPYAVYLMHKRCRDMSRSWVLSRSGKARARPVSFLSPEGIASSRRPERYEPAPPPYDDTAWLLANLLRTIDEARRGGRISAKARMAVRLWIELEHQALVAERLGVTPSRVSQLIHEVIDAVREIGVAS